MKAHSTTRDSGGRCGRARRRVLAGSGRLRRVWASILVVLVAAPFTSPFPTCDVRALFASATAVVSHSPSRAPGTIRLLSASLESDDAPVSLEEETFKDDIVLTDVVVFVAPRAERPRSTPVAAMIPVLRAPLVALRL